MERNTQHPFEHVQAPTAPSFKDPLGEDIILVRRAVMWTAVSPVQAVWIAAWIAVWEVVQGAQAVEGLLVGQVNNLRYFNLKYQEEWIAKASNMPLGLVILAFMVGLSVGPKLCMSLVLIPFFSLFSSFSISSLCFLLFLLHSFSYSSIPFSFLSHRPLSFLSISSFFLKYYITSLSHSVNRYDYPLDGDTLQVEDEEIKLLKFRKGDIINVYEQDTSGW